jgi:hypothetical protein
MGAENMAAVESTGTSSEIKEHTKKMKSLLEGIFFLLPHLQKLKGGSVER